MTDLPETMRAVQLVGHGDVDQLVYQDALPLPTLSDSDVLIKVGAAGVNNTDLNIRLGWYSKSGEDEEDAGWRDQPFHFPRIQGADVCGEIVAVGSQVDKSRIGERVLIEPCLLEMDGETLPEPAYFGAECDGGFAEYTKVAARHTHKVDSALSDIELASFPCSYSTAENLLTRTEVAAQDVVLVTGASGGVGSAAVQLAKARGAKVIAVTSPAKAKTLKEIGADVIVHRDESLLERLGANSVDVVIDLVGGDGLSCLMCSNRLGVMGYLAPLPDPLWRWICAPCTSKICV